MTDQNKRVYSCFMCEYKTTKCTDWIKHQQTKKHLRNGKKKISICEICSYESVSHWNVKLHKLSQHSTLEERKSHKYYCECCDLVFFCETYKEKHLNGKCHKNRELCQKIQEELNEKQKASGL